MSSRFWAGSDSSEEEEEDQLSDVSEEEDEEDEEQSESGEEASESGDESGEDSAAARFAIDAGSTTSSEGEGRQVLSKKTKQIQELTAQIFSLRNKLKINDWSSVQSEFDNVCKQVDRVRKVMENPNYHPRRFIRLMADLEKANNETLADKELLKKKMSPTNAKAANAMRQRLRKVMLQYEEQLKSYKDEPWDTDDEEEDDEKIDQQPTEDQEEEAPKETKKDEILSMNPDEIPYEMVSQKLREIVVSRGKKGTSKQEQVEMIDFLVRACKGPGQQVETIGQLVSSLFDMAPGVTAGNVPIPLWRRIAKSLLQLLQVLKQNPTLVLDENIDFMEERKEEQEEGEKIAVWGNLVAFVERLDDELFKIMQVTDPHTTEYLERMRDEPVFLAIAQMSAEYLERIGDRENLPKIVIRLIEHLYYKAEPVYHAVRDLVRTLQNVAEEENKENDIQENGVDAGQKKQEEKVAVPQDFQLPENPHGLIASLTKQIFGMGDERTKARAALCRIYHRCIHDAFYEARELMLMSHLQDNISNMDVPTQILHNRAIAQLGLAAFRQGLVQDAYHCLAELYSSGRVKELLAQGVQSSRYTDKTPEQEKLERMRQMPFHLHINLEMLETAHLVSAMLLDVVSIAAASSQATLAALGVVAKPKVVSKNFQRMLENYEKQHFIGPPENIRDHVLASARALLHGDWRSSWDFLSALYIWKLMPKGQQVLDTLKLRVKQEGLRAYLLRFGHMYATFSMSHLVEMTELTAKQVKSTVSKMMLNEELQASWDQPTNTIVMHNVQNLRWQDGQIDKLFDKVGVLCDLNERALALRSGGLHDVEEEGRQYKPWEEGGQGNRASNRAQGQRLGLPFNLGGGRGRGRGRDGAWGGRRGRSQGNMQTFRKSGKNQKN